MFSTDLAVSKDVIAEREQKVREESEWHKILTDPQAREDFFSKLTEADYSDHPHLKTIKKKIDKLVK